MSFDIIDFLQSIVELRIGEYLASLWGNEPWVAFALDVAGVLIISTFNLLIVLVLIWLLRKLVARIQDRIGPNRVGGRYGLLQTLADALKLLSKEQITPAGADRVPYNVAPILMVMSSLIVWAVMPFAPGVIGVDLNVGVFYILAITSISVVTLLLAGWGSNNKYALLGAFRSVAQLVSYEVPMILSLLIPILLARSMSTVDIVEAQGVPFLIVVPLAALIFFISVLAETGSTPFDLLEAESEIVAGFHVEYSGMKFAMFFLAEFLSAFFMSALFVVIFLGGYRFFGLENLMVGGWAVGHSLGLIIFFAKTFLVYSTIAWVRGTLPRVRIDQMLNFNWKFLVPLSLVLIFAVALVDKLLPSDVSTVTKALVMLLTNLAVGWAALEVLRWRTRRERMATVETAVADDHGHDDHHSHAVEAAAH